MTIFIFRLTVSGQGDNLVKSMKYRVESASRSGWTQVGYTRESDIIKICDYNKNE